MPRHRAPLLLALALLVLPACVVIEDGEVGVSKSFGSISDQAVGQGVSFVVPVARQIEVWAVLRSLGRSGIAQLVQRACDGAASIADRLRREDGFEVLNDVVLNQVLVRYRSSADTAALVAEIQRDGRIWCGSTKWDGGTAMRISVSSWKTTVADAERDATIVVECAGRLATTR